MNNGSVSAPGGTRIPPQTSQDQQKKKIPLESNQLLKAVASWVTYNDFLTMNKVMVEWRRSRRNADRASQDLSKELHPLLTLVSCGNDDVTLDENVRTILHVCLRFYMPKASLYSPRKMKNDARLIKALCELGASVIAECPGGSTPIKIALAEERFDLVDVMVQFSTAKATECNEQGDTILHVLLKNYGPNMCEHYNKKYLDIIDKFISMGANLNQRNKNGETPVLLTGKPFYAEILKKLINRGADLNCRTGSGDNLLMLACKSLDHKSNKFKADLKWINWLVKLGFDVNSKDNDGFTPLHYASQDKNLKALMKILLKAGADIHAVTHEGTNPLHLATTACNFEAMHYFIERGVEFNRRDIVHGLPLLFMIHPSIHLFEYEDTEWLIRNGFDRSEKGDLTLLHLAAAFGYVEIVKKLIERGANVHCKDNFYQYTPLHLASMRCEFATVPELCEAGLIDGKVSNDCISIKTHTASMSLYSRFYLSWDPEGIDYESTVLALLKAGADVHAMDNRGCTPLHYAARHKDENDLIVLLLEAEARVDELDSEDLSPLHNSLLSENEKGMKYLLSFGADINDVEHPRRDICKEIQGLGSSGSGVKSHLAKLKAAGLPVSHLYRPYLQDTIFQEDYAGYYEELDELKKRMLTSTVSLYDWLRIDWKWRFNLIDSLPLNVQHEFQHYGIVIQCLRNQAIDRNPLMEPARMAFQSLTPSWQWPYLCVEHVLSLLNNRTLRVLIDAAAECLA